MAATPRPSPIMTGVTSSTQVLRVAAVGGRIQTSATRVASFALTSHSPNSSAHQWVITHVTASNGRRRITGRTHSPMPGLPPIW